MRPSRLTARTWLLASFLIVEFCASTLGQTAADAANDFPGKVRLVLPEKIYAATGIEINVYFDNVVLVANPGNYLFDVTCDKGFQYERRWTYTPKRQEAGDYPIVVEVRDESNAILARARSTIRVSKPQAGRGGHFTFLAVGASQLQRSVWPQHLLDLSKTDDDLHLTLIGSRGADNRPATGELRHEGYNGWTAQAFATLWGPNSRTGHLKRPDTGSPFVYRSPPGPAILDFARYCREFNNGNSPDFVAIAIGGNDVFRCTDTDIDQKIDEVLGYCDRLIAMIHDVSRDTKIGWILVIPPSRQQHGFRNYRGPRKQTRWQYRRNQHHLVERMIQKYRRAEANNVFVIPTYLNIDVLHAYPVRSSPVSARMRGREERVNDGIHLSPEGDFQYADSIYCWMKATSP